MGSHDFSGTFCRFCGLDAQAAEASCSGNRVAALTAIHRRVCYDRDDLESRAQAAEATIAAVRRFVEEDIARLESIERTEFGEGSLVTARCMARKLDALAPAASANAARGEETP